MKNIIALSLFLVTVTSSLGQTQAKHSGSFENKQVSVKSKGDSNNTWKRVTITTYSHVYEGRRTANGETYRSKVMSVAVPQHKVNGRWRPVIPFGTTITLKYKGRSINVHVNDICPAGTYDLSSAAMSRLLGHYVSTKVHGELLIK